MTVKYLIDGSEVSYDECLEHFVMNSGFSSEDAKNVFNESNNSDCCDYINQECSDIEIIYQ